MDDLPMQDTVRRLIREYSLLHPGDRVLVAVSGGPDSVCLLHLLRELAPEFGVFLLAAHLDHRLRPESAEDARFVGSLCAGWGIPLLAAEVDVAAAAQKRRAGVEETARDVRRTFLQARAGEYGCRIIALGHHRGDQAETVLHRLLRGSGASGLAGMRPQEGAFIRPLLGVSRQQVLAYLARHRLAWVEDRSNLDPAYTRNRLRHEVLPLLAEFNPRIEEHLARLGRRLGLEEEFWQAEADRVLPASISGDGMALDCRRLRELHPALRLRVLRQAVMQVRGDLQAIAAIHLESIESLLHRVQPQGELYLPGLWVGRRYDRLWLRRTPPPAPPPIAVEIPEPGSFPLPGGVLHVGFEAAAQGEEPLTVEFDPATVSFPLRVRNVHPGDRFRPAGMAGRKKLKDFFIDAKLDREARRRVLVVEGSEILWLIGLRRCSSRRAGSGRVLRLRFQPISGDNLDC